MEKQADDSYYAAVGEAAKESKLEKAGSISSSSNQPNELELAGLVAPTEEEMDTLRHVPDKINWSATVNFIQQPLPKGSKTGAGGKHGVSGALGQKQQTSTGLTTLMQFWCYVTPLLGAYLADEKWGRFNTIAVSVAIALVGHIILIISAIPPVIVHPNGALAALSLAIIIMGLGTGGFKANISPLVAEQQRHLRAFISQTKSGERVIVNPTLTTSRIYMYFYFFINVGAMVGQIAMTFAEKVCLSWVLPCLHPPTAVFLLCPLVLYAGRNRYRRSPPQGSVLGKAIKLWAYAARGRWSANPITLYKNLKADDFWESAKPSNIPDSERPEWMTFDDKWVEEVRRGLKACSVFTWYPLYWLAYNQMVNNLTSQAATMVTNGVPNDVINNLDPLAPIKRITAGFLTGSLAMIWAAVVQHYVYKSGSYILIAFSEILASITGLEYAFTKAPKNMKSLVMATFYLLLLSPLPSAKPLTVTLSADPLLVWNYGTMAVLSGVGGVLFWFSFRRLDAEDTALDNIGRVTLSLE
ncbi:POT family-domain-containing protein [Multifurca ochricompacta]|uniref:POT family-domain-containing protein n=1 Tax=Multifurca ochricompacta TaxID=376703 RepID=A0AAD4M4Q3_9AGAM|nr:POT family-domain-containing protein [Multifurca ochricompacta]